MMSGTTASWYKLVSRSADADDQQNLEAHWVERVNGDRPLDPYLVWTSLTSFKYVAPQEPEWFPFLIETTDGAAKLIDEMTAALLGGQTHVGDVIKVPSAYRRSLVAGDSYLPSKFITALVNKYYFDWVASFVSVVRMQLGVARIGDVDGRTGSDLFETTESFPRDYSASDRAPERSNSDPAKTELNTVLGVIDDGCNFAHPAYMSQSGTRVEIGRASCRERV